MTNTKEAAKELNLNFTLVGYVVIDTHTNEPADNKSGQRLYTKIGYARNAVSQLNYYWPYSKYTVKPIYGVVYNAE